MNSFRSLTSRIILAGVAGIIVCFVLAYNFKFGCYLGKVEIAPLQYPFICTDANGTVDIWSRYVGFVFGVVVLLAAINLEYRKGLKFEFWVTMSSLLVALIILPLYALIVSANGIDTGYYAIIGTGKGGYLTLSFPYTVPAITQIEQLALTLMSTVAGILSGPVLDKASKNRPSRVKPTSRVSDASPT